MHLMAWALTFARASAGRSNPARMAMMAMMTRSSMSVNATLGLGGMGRGYWNGTLHSSDKRGIISVRARGESTRHQNPNTKLQRNPGIETTKNQAPNTKEIPSSKLQTAARASSLELGAP